MSLESVKQAYQGWEIFESEPTRMLKDEIRQIMENPTDESDAFFKSIVDDYSSDNTDGFWIRQAINYGNYEGRNKHIPISYLQNMLLSADSFWVIGGSLGMAASFLGKISPYPNQVLANTIEIDWYDKNNEQAHDGKLSKIASDGLRVSAYGGYIMTATDFQTGFDAGQAVEASGKQPTVAMAEAFIAKWRKENGKKEVSQ